jgi:hypothetical protein
MPWSSPVGSPTATTCVRGPSPGSPRSWPPCRASPPPAGPWSGFQILTEAHLLPGALQKNAGLRFLCAPTELEVASDTSVLTAGVAVGTRLSIPINHFEGNYLCDPATLDELRAEGRIVLRYVDNPNGSVDDIAGIANAAGNVVGLMPHPERASDPLLGSTDGRILLAALLVSAGAVLAGGGLAGGGVTAAGAGAVS